MGLAWGTGTIRGGGAVGGPMGAASGGGGMVGIITSG